MKSLHNYVDSLLEATDNTDMPGYDDLSDFCTNCAEPLVEGQICGNCEVIVKELNRGSK